MEADMAEATKLPVKSDQKPVTSTAADPWATFKDLRQEIDRAFENFGRSTWLRPFDFEPLLKTTFGSSSPAIDIVEHDTEFEMTAELPGMTPKDVDVSLKNGSLVIKGEKHDERKEESKGYYLHERKYGSFERSFTVPAGVDRSAIEATFNNGVLKVTLPKTHEAQAPAKKIEVKAA
jgi:HSP20 family protein